MNERGKTMSDNPDREIHVLSKTRANYGHYYSGIVSCAIIKTVARFLCAIEMKSKCGISAHTHCKLECTRLVTDLYNISTNLYLTGDATSPPWHWLQSPSTFVHSGQSAEVVYVGSIRSYNIKMLLDWIK